MPKRPPKNSTWVQLTRDFVKEWPEVLEGIHFQNMPVKYLHYVSISLKNNITIPTDYQLYLNHPNPFNPITSLRYDLPEDGLVSITIYDMMGRIVKTLVNGSQTVGFKSVQWNATNDRDEAVSAGLYLYTIEVGEFRQTKKMVLLK